MNTKTSASRAVVLKKEDETEDLPARIEELDKKIEEMIGHADLYNSTEEKQTVFLKKRNALYAQRKYYRKKLKIKHLEEERDEFVAKNASVQKENLFLEQLLASAKEQVRTLKMLEFQKTSSALTGVGSLTGSLLSMPLQMSQEEPSLREFALRLLQNEQQRRKSSLSGLASLPPGTTTPMMQDELLLAALCQKGQTTLPSEQPLSAMEVWRERAPLRLANSRPDLTSAPTGAQLLHSSFLLDRKQQQQQRLSLPILRRRASSLEGFRLSETTAFKRNLVDQALKKALGAMRSNHHAMALAAPSIPPPPMLSSSHLDALLPGERELCPQHAAVAAAANAAAAPTAAAAWSHEVAYLLQQQHRQGF